MKTKNLILDTAIIAAILLVLLPISIAIMLIIAILAILYTQTQRKK